MTAEAPSLDGKSFDVRLENANGLAQDGQLVFQRGTLMSTVHKSSGFDPAACKISMQSTKTHFEAKAKSPKEGNIEWAGDVSGDKLTGRLVWKLQSGEVREQRFDGRLSR